MATNVNASKGLEEVQTGTIRTEIPARLDRLPWRASTGS